MTHGMEHGHGCGTHEHGGHGGMKSHHSCPVCGLAHHACPMCGMSHHGGGKGMGARCGSGDLVKMSTKKLLMEKMKAKIDERHGDKLDAIATELVDMAEEKMKMKKEMWKRKKEMKMRLHEIMAEDMAEGGEE